MNRFTMTNLAMMMSHKVSPKEIEKIVDRLEILPAEQVEIADFQEVRVAAVQVMLKRYTSLADYIIDMNLYVADAVNRRAQLIVFPAYSGFLPASFLPQFEESLSKLAPNPETGLPEIQVLGERLSVFSDSIHDAFFYTMSALAARHRVYIMAGSSLYFEEDDLRHRAFLFGRTGELAGFQDKVSLDQLERALQLEPASEIKVFDTPVGPVSILTGSDADYYENARIAKGLGARILLHPAFLTGEYTPIKLAMGINMRVQESTLFGVQSVMVGDTGLGPVAEGASCVFAPAEMTRAQNGVLARSSGRNEPDIICPTLSMERLEELRNPYRSDKNPEFLDKYIDRLY